jgi:hypothetical protein
MITQQITGREKKFPVEEGAGIEIQYKIFIDNEINLLMVKYEKFRSFKYLSIP